MKQKIIFFLLCDCISYTILSFVMFILSFFPSLVMSGSHQVYMSFFIVTTFIAFLITLTSCFEFSSFWQECFTLLIEIFLVVYGIGGGIFHWFEWKWVYLIEVAFICAIVFFITYILIYYHEQYIARKINQKIEDENHENY